MFIYSPLRLYSTFSSWRFFDRRSSFRLFVSTSDPLIRSAASCLDAGAWGGRGEGVVRSVGKCRFRLLIRRERLSRRIPSAAILFPSEGQKRFNCATERGKYSARSRLWGGKTRSCAVTSSGSTTLLRNTNVTMATHSANWRRDTNEGNEGSPKRYRRKADDATNWITKYERRRKRRTDWRTSCAATNDSVEGRSYRTPRYSSIDWKDVKTEQRKLNTR